MRIKFVHFVRDDLMLEGGFHVTNCWNASDAVDLPHIDYLPSRWCCHIHPLPCMTSKWLCVRVGGLETGRGRDSGNVPESLTPEMCVSCRTHYTFRWECCRLQCPLVSSTRSCIRSKAREIYRFSRSRSSLLPRWERVSHTGMNGQVSIVSGCCMFSFVVFRSSKELGVSIAV